MRLIKLVFVILATVAPVWPQGDQFKTADAVLDRYKHALGGVEVIQKVQSEIVRGVVEGNGMPGPATFVYHAKP